MKRCAILTTALYGAALILLTLPVLLVGALRRSSPETGWVPEVTANQALELFTHWGYLLWLFVLIAGQATLLLVPVQKDAQRPIRRRTLLAPLTVSSFFLANLLLAGVFSLLSAFWGDNVSKVVEVPAEAGEQIAFGIRPVAAFLNSIGATANSISFEIVTLLGMLVLLWLIWALVFFHYSQSDTADTLIQRATRWLLIGSVLELLVAVPSHVIVRQRNDCCAPIATFWGIATGISVMLLSFGPGVYFLFAARCRKLRPPIHSSPSAPQR